MLAAMAAEAAAWARAVVASNERTNERLLGERAPEGWASSVRLSVELVRGWATAVRARARAKEGHRRMLGCRVVLLLVISASVDRLGLRERYSFSLC